MSEWEARLNVHIPVPLQLFYRYPALGCWLMAHQETDIFLEEYAESDCPRVITWWYRRYMVLAEFVHSQTICAVEVDTDNPRMEWGGDGASKPFDYPPCFLVRWLMGIAVEVRQRMTATTGESAAASIAKRPQHGKSLNRQDNEG